MSGDANWDDEFTPSAMSERLPGSLLELRGRHYIESAEKGSEVWVYFHGRHAFTDGVYIKAPCTPSTCTAAGSFCASVSSRLRRG